MWYMRNQYAKKQLTGWLEALIQQYKKKWNPTINYITLKKTINYNTFKNEKSKNYYTFIVGAKFYKQ